MTRGLVGKPRTTTLPTDRPCTKCGKSYPEVEFQLREKGYRKSQCRDCHNKRIREAYAADPLKHAERIKAYEEANPEKVRERKKRYHAANRQKILARQRERYKNLTPEMRRKLYEGRARWAKENPSKDRRRVHIRRARLLGVGGQWTAEEWLELKAYYNHTCLCCGRREPEIKLTFDHVVPVSQGGANNIQNAQPLCWSCNSRKHNKTTDYRKTAAEVAA